MPDLSVQNIEQVRNDICRQEISFSHLLDELIDHVCCDIENEMLNGLSFSDAYEKVKIKTGPGRLREIQKETLYAVDLKYRNMRNTMKISGIAGTALFGFAALFKIQHWPLAGIMMTLGAITLALIFLPAALGVLWKETHNRSRLFLFISVFMTGFLFIAGTLFKIQHWPAAAIMLVLSTASAVMMLLPSLLVIILKYESDRSMKPIYILAATGSFFYVIGMLFKIQHWPMAGLFTMMGIFFLGYLVLPWYSILKWKDETYIEPKFIFMIVAIMAIIVPGALINLNLQKNYNEGYYYNQDRQDALYQYLMRNNSNLITAMQDSSAVRKSEILHKETLNLIGKIDDIREEMIRESETRDPKNSVSMSGLNQPGNGFDVRYINLSRPLDITPVMDFLMPGCNKRADLETDIKNYVVNSGKLIPGNKDIIAILDPSLYLPASVESRMSLLSALNSLDLLRNCVLAVEAGLLKSLNSDNNQ